MSNRQFQNFSEYGLKGDFALLNLPNAFSTSFTPYIQGLTPKFEILPPSKEQLNKVEITK
jgi:hypothetical protein